jgi:hypothetical protein
MPVTNIPSPGSPIVSSWAQSVSTVANASEATLATHRMASGTATVATVGGGGAQTAVTFPAGRFSAAPAVTLTPVSNAPQVLHTSVLSAPSASGFSIQLYRDTGSGNVVVHWHAMQVP